MTKRMPLKKGNYSFDDPNIGSEWEPVVPENRAIPSNPNPQINQAQQAVNQAIANEPMPNWGNESYSQQSLFNDGGAIPPDEMGVPRIAGQRNVLQRFWDGAVAGYTDQQRDPNSRYKEGRYARSVFVDALNAIKGKDVAQPNLPGFDEALPRGRAYRVGEVLGRVGGDVTGFGTQKIAWTMHPMDIASTYSFDALRKLNIDPRMARLGSYGTALALGVGSNNFNPFNLAEGGRQAGFEAISANEDDPRKSDNAVLDMVFNRGLLGRTGKLLPWEQFSQERPNVSYDQYEKYKEYLRDPGFLGLVKGTTEGVDGPEARIMGYRVTPLGAVAALGTLGAVAAGARLAGKRRMN